MARGDRGADALVRTLAHRGIRRIFTLSGNHIMPVFDAALDAGIDLIHTRHEAAAVHMADAFARLTDGVAVAMVTGGPGHANAVGALYTATMAESPVVLLSGHSPSDERSMGAFQEMAQAEIAAPITKASWLCRKADDVASDMERAMRLARSGRPGSVHLSLPTDCLEGHSEDVILDAPGDRSQLDAGCALSPKQRSGIQEAITGHPGHLGENDADAILDRLYRAKRPLILAGPASTTKSGRSRMHSLEEATGIPVIGMESPRGIADPSLGAFAEILAQADCVLLLGKRLDFTLKFGRSPALNADCEFLHVDCESQEIDRTRSAVGSRLAGNALAEIFPAAQSLARRAARQSGSWLEEVRSALAYRPGAWDTASSSETGRLHPVQALRPLQALLDAHADSVFVCDGGEIGQWAQACLRAPNRVINGVAGSIGAALPFAVAARLAKPGAPVIAVMGDGTFGFHASEIDTAVRYRLPFVAVVGNDARWNAEYQIQLREYGRERAKGCELLATRYDEVCAAFGGYGECVTRAGDVLAAAQRAVRSGRPSCLNVMIEGVPAPSITRP